MKSLGVGSTFAIFLLGLAAAPASHAQTAGPAASGSFWFVLEDEVPKFVEFDAVNDERGATTGVMTFMDQARIPDIDDPEDPRSGDAPPEFAMKAQLDSLTIEKNRAVMNGTILDSSHRNYVGGFVQLVVEDNRGNQEVPDLLTWAFCRRRSGGWIPSDAEWTDDQGAFLSWWATDAERSDDVGIPSPDLLPGEERSCRIYALPVYSFADLLRWDGDIVVQP